MPWQRLPAYMAELVAFAAEKTAQNDLIKAAILHFAFAYLHPYFDGNGRMARLLHLWYLVQQGYSSALFVPMSRFVEESRSRYYKAYTQVEQNQQISGVLDVISFDLKEILLETEQGMLTIKGADLHVNRLTLEKGEVDIEGRIDSMAYSEVTDFHKAGASLLGRLFK